MNRRIGLVGCVKEKLLVPAPAQDLYISPLFVGRRAYVERSCGEWWILSALHGLVNREMVLAPYDLALKSLGRAARREWARRVLDEVHAEIRPSSGNVFEIHAGSEYRDFGLVEGVMNMGCDVENPVKGLTVGYQLQFYRASSAASGG